MNEIKKELGKKIKYYREQNNLTQEQLAEMISLNFRSLSLIERGINFITADTLDKLCKTLKVTPKNLFDFNYIEENPKDKKETILKILDNNNEKIDTIYKLLKAFLFATDEK